MTLELRRLRGPWLAAAVIVAVTGRPAPAAEPPNVVATILPVHALVARVMGMAGAPWLLVPPGASPHTHALRPSDARALANADLVVWVGPELEHFLARSLDALAPDALRLSLLRDAGIATLPVRRGGVWIDDGEDHAAHDAATDTDPHIWLDPANARAIVRAVAGALAGLDPERAGTYRANATAAERDLDALEREIGARLAPVADRPFVVFHDAYVYLERRYGLHAAGSIMRDAEQPPGARRLIALRDRIAAARVPCVFAEPQFSPKLVATVVEGTGAEAGTLDPVGAGPPGPAAYQRMMRALADALVACLGAPADAPN
ncbi:MAG: zinc ABC transporter substrate-binding protein [Alphaproteobacteria bacterium]